MAGGPLPPPGVPDTVVTLSGVRFRWSRASEVVLDIDELVIARGERVFVQGPSGSGKSSLLSLLSGVVVPDAGTVDVLGTRLASLPEAARDRFRADHVGVIFQAFNLIPYLSVTENVTLACAFSALRRKHAIRISGSVEAEAARLLAHLDMAAPGIVGRPVTALSMGQQQRVAAARALMGTPELVIADEPTSSLDADHRRAFVDLLLAECAREGTTVVFVSHDASLAPQFDRVIALGEINRMRAAVPA